jgi:hypothetical protein
MTADPWQEFQAMTPDICARCASHAEGEYPCRTLRALAAVYADHPDYRDEWKP